MNRRRFCRDLAVATSTVTIGASGARLVRAASKRDWQSIRAEFNTHPGWTNMAAFFLASHPKPVRDSIEYYRKLLDRCPCGEIEDNMRRYETAVRKAIVSYFGGHSYDYAVTGSTTMGLGTIYGGLKIRAPQEVLSTTHDHPATSMSLSFASQRLGFGLRRIQLYSDSAQASVSEILKNIADNIRPETRVLALTWVHSCTGVKLPISQISAMVKLLNSHRSEKDRLILSVDGVHGFGVENTTIEELGCDFFIAGCHKWVFGPRGTGLVYGTRRAWSATSPTIPSFDAIWRGGAETMAVPAAMMTPGGFHAFEHFWSLPAAFEMHQAIGKKAIYERTASLNRSLKEGLSKMRNVRVYTPMADELSCGLVCFGVEGLRPREVVARLRSKKVIATETPYRVSYARLSASLLNDERDVDTTLSAVRSLT